MTRDDPIGHYLEEVGAFLHVGVERRRRVLEEIESHLRDRVAAEMEGGVSADAVAERVLADFGRPDVVATGFNDEAAPVRTDRGARRWLPMVLPVAMLALALGVTLVRLVAWWPDGMTAGQGHVLRAYLVIGAVAAALSAAAYAAIRRADTDRAWRVAAWACSPVAAALLLT